jgi:hypothetical protein
MAGVDCGEVVWRQAQGSWSDDNKHFCILQIGRIFTGQKPNTRY